MQDGGRAGYRAFGVPLGGAYDRESLFLANALLGNEPIAPALEIALLGATFEAEADLEVAVVGAEGSAEVDGCPVPRQARLGLRRGQNLLLGPASKGARVYLAARGGFRVKPILNSASGVAVSAGQSLECDPFSSLGDARLSGSPQTLQRTNLRFVDGPQAKLFEPLENRHYKVSLNSDRVGLRLEGTATPHTMEMPSEPACWGAIQVTPSGAPIVLGPDGPTIGGYPKVGVVISADLDVLGQLRPGAEIAFERVTLEVAQDLWSERRSRLEGLRRRLTLPLANPAPDIRP